jgi:hypothetical protein
MSEIRVCWWRRWRRKYTMGRPSFGIFFRHLLSAFIRQTLEKCLFDHREWGFWRKSMASQESVLAKLCINDE